jgi:hypothetical protein
MWDDPVIRLQDLKTINHRPMIRSAILAEDCSYCQRYVNWQSYFYEINKQRVGYRWLG